MSLFASSNTTATRTRSLRAPAKQAPAVAAPQHAAPSTATGPLNAQVPSSTSHLSIFFTNLRLLDLDLEPEWPGITPATFSARDAAGGQKKRIQCVEWVLYQLFAIWDYNETQNKLRPFFPPLDQVQSVNLRAALTRLLEQAKRNGTLGRDAIIRKTMLDECKGERLEEVLAAFSSAVLKKLVAERSLNSGSEYYSSISEKISVENWGYTGERTELIGLLLAHKVSLTGALAKKDAARARYRDFEELLALKERGLARRKEQVKVLAKHSDDSQVTDQVRSDVRRILRTNWTGNDQWADSILYGGSDARKGSLLSAPFDDVWKGVQEGRLSDLEEQSTDLVGQLDQRVRLQRSRLEKWDVFRQKMFGSKVNAPVTPRRKQEHSTRMIEFKAHKGLHLDAHAALEFSDPEPLASEYAAIIDDMKSELSGIGKPNIPDFAKLLGSTSARLGTQRLSVGSAAPDPISDLSEWEDEPSEERIPVPEPAKPPPARQIAQPERYESALPRHPVTEAVVIRKNSRIRKAAPKPLVEEVQVPPQPSISRRHARDCSPEKELVDSVQHKEAQWESNSLQMEPEADFGPMEHSPLEEEFPQPASPPLAASPTRAAADEILAYMSNASPSPPKRPRHTLSLEERTRMSMTRTKPFEAEESDGGRLSPVKHGYPDIPEEAVKNDNVEQGNGYEDLIARTRRSMVGFEAARQKAQLDRRRSQRKSKIIPRKDSYFPKVEEEDGAGGDTSVMDEILETGQEDYEAIFRSRPKIKTSPAPSPTKEWDED